MAKSRKELLQGYGVMVADHMRRVFRYEQSPADAVTAWAQDTRQLYRKLTKPPPTPGRKAAIHYLKLGMADYNAGHLKSAEEYMRRAVSSDEQYARAHAYLGNTLYRRGRLAEAVGAWNQAVESEPGSEAAQMALAKLHRLGKGADGVVNNLKDQMKTARWS